MTRVVVPLLAVLLAVCSPAQPPTPADDAARNIPAPSQTATRGPSRLRIDGAQFRTADGQPFIWRGLSAFRLIELIARGREREAIALLDWAAARRVTVVRSFVMAHHLFQLKPDEGLASLPRLLELAAARALHVEVVAFADTGEIEVDFAQQMKAVGSIVAAHANAVLEVANEPWHPTQDPHLHTPAKLKKLADLLPPEVLVALGSAEGDDGYAGGDYVTWHSPRGSGDQGWEHVLSVAEGATLLAKWRKPTVSDEPIGAGSALAPGRRDNNPSRFGAAAAVTRLAGLGATFHYEGGLQSRIPSGVELECFSAWSSALDLLRDLPEGGGFVAGAQLAKIATVQHARAAFGRVYANEVWIVAVDPREETSITLLGAWPKQTTKDSRGVRLFHARR